MDNAQDVLIIAIQMKILRTVFQTSVVQWRYLPLRVRAPHVEAIVILMRKVKVAYLMIAQIIVRYYTQMELARRVLTTQCPI